MNPPLPPSLSPRPAAPARGVNAPAVLRRPRRKATARGCALDRVPEEALLVVRRGLCAEPTLARPPAVVG
eukprot:scaffold5846_cov333-Prasinococcus_capsulatus_cf.AAC.3